VCSSVCGQLGKQAQLQVTVTLSIATIMPACRSPIGCICAVWTDDAARREKALFRPRSGQDQAADCAGADPRGSEAAFAPGVVLMDASYGNNSKLPPGPHGWGSATSQPSYDRQSTPGARGDPKPPRVSVEALALSLPKARLAHRHVAGRHQR